MEKDPEEFDLSNFISDSLCLDDITSPYVKRQYNKKVEDPIEKIVSKDPRELLGFYSFGKPRKIPESTTGTTVQEFYRGLNIFITGGTGFVGKILIEKLIRSIPHLGQIYVLVRTKKGVSAIDRFEKLLEDEVFLRMKTEVPDYQSKLTFIEGDIFEPELGLSEADRSTLQNQVHILFHSAADVRFINSLRAAINANFVGSKRVIELAKGMKNLKSYVHVSTAYSNCVRRVIEEKVYKMNVSHTEILKLLEEKSDDEIMKEEKRILQEWPNTYTFSKALCEDMLSEEAKDLPICIFRPSVVGPTYQEPLRGWTDNIYGPLGMLIAAKLGVIHIMKVDMEIPIALVPVDFSVNAMIAVAWENATARINSMPVYNFTTSPSNPFTWTKIDFIGRKWTVPFPLLQGVWYPSYLCTSNDFLKKVGDFFLHNIPGHILDRIAVARGGEPRLTKIYNRLSILADKLDYFGFRTWDFDNDNTAQLFNKLSKEDKQLFPYDISEICAVDYIVVCQLGIKYFYLKESLETMADAQKKLLWLKLAHYLLLGVSSLAALKVLVTLAHIIPI